jgi:hypothetical protein
MNVRSFVQTTAAVMFLVGSASAAFAQEVAPENRSGSTMDRDGGPTGLDMKVYQTRMPPYANSPYASTRGSVTSGPYGEYQAK